MPVSAYPTLELGGPRPLKYEAEPPDYKALVQMHTYEDKGVSRLSTGDEPPRAWSMEYGLLEKWEYQILLDHREEARHNELPFSFTDREGTAWTGVYYDVFDPAPDLAGFKGCRVRLVRPPS